MLYHLFQRLIKEQKLFETTAEDVKAQLEANYQTQESLKVNLIFFNFLNCIPERLNYIELDKTRRKIVLLITV